jgi:hypothetical protein
MPPTYAVFVDWDNSGDVGGPGTIDALGTTTIDGLGTMTIDGLASVISLEDVSADVRLSTPLTASYGRDQARAYSPPMAGKSAFLLDNTDGKYASLNASSPLFGKLNPGLRCRSTITLLGTTYGLHDGYLGEPSELPGIRQQLVSETSYDGLEKLRAAIISTAELVGARIDEAIAACLDAANWPADRRALAVADTTLVRWCVDGIDAGKAIRDLAFSEGAGAAFFIDPDTSYATFLNRNYRLLTSRCTTSQMTARSQGPEPLFEQDFAFDPGVRNIVNACTVPVNSYALGAVGAVWTGPTPVTLAANEVRTYAVSTTADWFTAAAAPTSGAGDFTVTAGSLVSATLDRTSGKRCTLTLTAGASGATLTGLRIRAQTVTITKTDVSNTVSGAAASGIDYGVRTFRDEFIPTWLPDLNTAQDFCNYVVSRYKDPVPTVRFAVNSQSDARLAAVLPRKFSDRITVVEPLRAYLNDDFFVEQIADEVSPGGNHRRIFGCEKASDQAFWVLGVAGYSELGQTTVPGY